MHNGALHGYLERTRLTVERKLQLVRFIVYQITPPSINIFIQLKQVVNGLGYRMKSLFPEKIILTTSLVHQKDVIHGDLTSVGII